MISFGRSEHLVHDGRYVGVAGGTNSQQETGAATAAIVAMVSSQLAAIAS